MACGACFPIEAATLLIALGATAALLSVIALGWFVAEALYYLCPRRIVLPAFRQDSLNALYVRLIVQHLTHARVQFRPRLHG